MYDNPKHVKDNRVSLRINDYELERLSRLAEKHGKQKTTLAYEALVEFLEKLEKEYSEEEEEETEAG